jgi:hypothetical protein
VASARVRLSGPCLAPTLGGCILGLAPGCSATRLPPSEVRRLCAPVFRRVCPCRTYSGIVIHRRHDTYAGRPFRPWLMGFQELRQDEVQLRASLHTAKDSQRGSKKKGAAAPDLGCYCTSRSSSAHLPSVPTHTTFSRTCCMSSSKSHRPRHSEGCPDPLGCRLVHRDRREP